ncbi:hypothetical protein NECAME_05250 [Necator americanus]|uniref:Uncharacterized protein n=1 Tax=Necator americanus TaxID=51031 RepID=W2SIJ1_NECAM|nr:hypothetical protein NECAME_05250 [Necator americanus]ETN69395.1 hypothetical protein NECAME_05250 [Necator americanus]
MDVRTLPCIDCTLRTGQEPARLSPQRSYPKFMERDKTCLVELKENGRTEKVKKSPTNVPKPMVVPATNEAPMAKPSVKLCAKSATRLR